MRPASLRTRLLAGMVALVAIGLGVAAFATYEVQRSFLLDRVDQQVQTAIAPISFTLRARAGLDRFPGTRGGQGPPARFGNRPPGLRPEPTLPPGTFGQLRGPSGRVLATTTFSYGAQTPAGPDLPSSFPVSRPGSALKVFTVPSRLGSGANYRAAAFEVGGYTLVVAVPLKEVNDTLHRLIVTELLVGAGVIAALILLGWVVIGVGLRPLERIGKTARQIAHGDLSRRVSPADVRTEVGRLGTSLNEMLTQIERAFDDRQASEARLRSFLADASHELRTPLASIRGYAELFRLGAADDPEKLERTMDGIESEASRMGVLVDEMLLLARLDQEPEPRRVPVDLNDLLDRSAQNARAVAPDREITVLPSDEVTVLGDPDQLRRLVANLLANALLHTPPATGIELSLSLDRADAVIAVRDHGHGLPAGAGEQIFERFWRAEAGRSRGAGGAGLGLAIVKAITLAHHGTVVATDAPGGGAQFTVRLPTSAEQISQGTLSQLTAVSYPNLPDSSADEPLNEAPGRPRDPEAAR